ncbi:MAG: protein kinase [Alphaproteobacteria bacterium]|nr:protein kinase [Alphaproteobacteria bacterium]
MKTLAPLPELPERYRPLALLGEGATGSVYRADDRVLGVDVALKVVRPNLAMHARFRARFAREVALSAQVVHPRLVPVHDTGRLPDGRPFVALAYADAGSLGSMMAADPSLGDALRLVDQVLDALAALHARGVLHQDLKPANVLLHRSGGVIDAWVADLGVAAALSELAMNKRSISGTPTWMAPEQLTAAHHELGPWTDLYAVGLILHALVAGPPPADVRARKSQLDQRLEAVPELPDGVPAPLALVIRNLLEPDPRQRYDRAADVRRALRDATADLDLAADANPDLEMLGDHSDSVGPGETSFSASILPEAQQAIVVPHRGVRSAVAHAPRWNRVSPDRMPLRPPSPRTLGSGRTSLGLFALRDPPVIAREPIRRLLWQKARETIASSRPQVVLVVGDAGSGKSRVVESVQRALEEGGFMEAVVLRYHDPPGVDDGYRGGVREILAPWNDTRERLHARLTRWLARDQQVAPQAVAGEAEVLARWCGYRTENEQPVNAAVGLAFLYRHLDARAWRGGACLVLEDAHLARAEGDGLGICDAVLSEAVGRRPLVVMASIAAKALEEDEALAARVKSLVARGALQVSCNRMRDAEMEQLLVMSLNLSPELAAAVAPRCEGSPGFATLMLRDWAARGLLVRDSEMHFSLREDLQVQYVLAPDLDSLCERRLAGALATCEDPDAASMALAGVALAGQVPPVSVVQAVHPEGLDALLATGLVRQQGWRIVFEHPKLRELALSMAEQRSDLQSLHRRLADAWEALGKRTGVEVALPLGRHRLRSGAPKAAMGPLVQASRSAVVEGRFALSLEAARLAEEAAEMVGALPGRVMARHQQAEALLELDRSHAAAEVLSETFRLGHVDRNTTAHLRVQEARAAIEAGAMVHARRLLDNAMATFEATRDRVGQVDAARWSAVLERLEGRPDEAADLYARMLRTNRGDLRREAIALFGLVEASIAAGRLRGVDRTVERLRQVARESGDTRNIAQATFAGGLLHLRRKHLQEAERHFLTARALAATLGADNLLLACLTNLSEIHRYRGDDKEAEETLRLAARLATERRWSLQAATCRVQLGLLALAKGADRLAHIEIVRAERLLEDHPTHYGWQAIGIVRALWAAEDEEQNEARAWWQRARKAGLGRQPPPPDLWRPLERLGALAEERGWTELARAARQLSHTGSATSTEAEVEMEIVEEDEEWDASVSDLSATEVVTGKNAHQLEDPYMVFDELPSEALDPLPDANLGVLPDDVPPPEDGPPPVRSESGFWPAVDAPTVIPTDAPEPPPRRSLARTQDEEEIPTLRADEEDTALQPAAPWDVPPTRKR